MSTRNLVVLYGSQTGNAQDIAERLWRESRFYNFVGPVLCMDDYPVQQLIFEPLVVFVVSTTGQGEEPDNMKNFWNFLLRRNLPINSLCNVKFAVLGLGDSSYVKFNFVAKRLTRRLTNLGGIAVVDPGYADEQHALGIDAVVDSWIDTLWTKLGGLFNFTKKTVLQTFEPRWKVSVVHPNSSDDIKLQEEKSETGEKFNKSQYSQRSPCELYVIENNRITSPDHFQDVRLIKLMSPNTLTYTPGDVLMTVPQNSDENVKLFFCIINDGRSHEDEISPSCLVQVVQKDEGLPAPRDLASPIRLDECAKKFWDLNAVPRRSIFNILAQVTVNELEKEKLNEFAMSDGLEDLYNYCNRPRRTILEVLADFPHASRALTLEMLFDVLQPIKPRAFSIASSHVMNPGEVHILLAVVKYNTKLLKPRQGLCSTYLAELQVGASIFGWIRSGSFRFPSPGSRAIMIGPGTGVAPFRSYIQELAAAGQADQANLLLFFGCRNQNADFHFAEEWKNLIGKGFLKMIVAFSRDQSDKIYVQHRIREFGEDVWARLMDGATILVAGSSKNMPASVREAFVEVAQTHGGLSPEKAAAFIENLERSGRYQTETWS